MTFPLYGEPREDTRLRQMILLSAILHVVAIVWIVIGGTFFRSTQPRATAISVELINPAALGTNLPNGGKGRSRTEGESNTLPNLPAPPLPPTQEVKPQPQEEKPLQSAPRKEEPKPAPPPPVPQKEVVKFPEKENPEKKLSGKPESEKVKVEEKKLEPKKVEPKPEPAKVAKTEEKKPEVKKEPEKTPPKKIEEKKAEAKSPEPQKVEAKPQKPESKTEKSEMNPAVEKKPEGTPVKTESASPDERDRQISAALERIKSQVQPKDESGTTNTPLGSGPKGVGPITKGGEAGEGGGGAVRGIEFILYTQQLQRRVQESWIVAEKRPELVASVSFRIQADGEVQDIEMMKSSGDAAFDQSVLRAVRKAAPFPPPPQSYANEFATQKIFMNFGGEGRVN
jgi:TolA protein